MKSFKKVNGLEEIRVDGGRFGGIGLILPLPPKRIKPPGQRIPPIFRPH